jgi:hypothetical protein
MENIRTESITVLLPAIWVIKNKIIATNENVKAINDHILLDFLRLMYRPKHVTLNSTNMTISKRFSPCKGSF